MARAGSAFITRALTAVVIGVVAIAAVLFGRVIGLAAVVALIAILAAGELYAITRREHRLPNEVFGLVAVAAMPLAAAYGGLSGLGAVIAVLIVGALAWHLAFPKVMLTDTAVTLFGAVYIGFTLSHLVLLRQLDGGSELVLITLVSVWANDISAYLVGSSVGRHKMAPHISPAKSWEGFAAGTLFTIAVWGAAHFLVDTGASLTWHLAIGLAVSVAAVVGDLAESRFKREAAVKDSGNGLPGHGGFLDRFDSLILVSVVAYYMLLFASRGVR